MCWYLSGGKMVDRLFVLVFWWWMVVGDDCDGVVNVIGIINCWWIDYCIGCFCSGVDFIVVVWIVRWVEYGYVVYYL